MAEETDFFEVSRVTGHDIMDDGTYQFYVNWKGSDEPGVVMEEDMRCPDLIQEYFNRLIKQRKNPKDKHGQDAFINPHYNSTQRRRYRKREAKRQAAHHPESLLNRVDMT